MPGPLDRVLDILRGGGAASGRESVAPVHGTTGSPEGDGATAAAWLAEVLSEGVLWLDDAGRIRDANPAACRLLGSRRPDLLGHSLLEAAHSTALESLRRDAQAEARASGDGAPAAAAVREAEVRLVNGDRTLLARVFWFGDSGLAVLEDRTELLRLRTVRTEFVANVSHELRTPLASIRATAETLLDGAAADPDAAGRFLETILREVDRLVLLSEDLLELSRAEEAHAPRELAVVDVGGLLDEVAARLRAQAEQRGVRVTVNGGPSGAAVAAAGRVPVRANRMEMDQVLFNLLDNAIKYTPAGGEVSAHAAAAAAGGDAVEIVVADTGIGILAQDLPRIFERFWRADRARRFPSGEGGRGTGGTGLGLSIVKHIVEANGGNVRAESELGRGSRFTVTLPLFTGGEEPPAADS